MNCVLQNFGRNLLQLKQLKCIQIVALSKVPYNQNYALQRRQVVLRLKELKRLEHYRMKEKKKKEESRRKQMLLPPAEFKLNWNPLLSKKANVLNFFKSEGLTFPAEDIDKHKNQLNAFSFSRLVALLWHLKRTGVKFDQLNIKKILTFKYYGRIYPKSQTSVHGEFYEYLTEPRIDKELKELIVVHEKDVTENLKCLNSFGFSFEEIASCPLVVCHSPEVLLVYLYSLQKRQELQPFEELGKDKKKVINLIQYYIEKNHSFTTQVVKEDRQAFLSYELDVSNQ
ncbi:uncharacterized protein LOC110448631 [Mizuhopecten yessoensis]|uniref:uncharacterized protein LOC110448631 n=1 Tax=Mizuhopecten yessoensis TaxID=6573 RepID=UPI000B45B57B|nr:uncharacterized protein LOC110448631 [Mizuhopecten yessoensis]